MQRSETRRGIGSPGTRVTDGGEPPCGCWEPNPGPLRGQQVLLNTEPSLQPQAFCFLRKEEKQGMMAQACNPKTGGLGEFWASLGYSVSPV